jgi:hypothetical protein
VARFSILDDEDSAPASGKKKLQPAAAQAVRGDSVSPAAARHGHCKCLASISTGPRRKGDAGGERCGVERDVYSNVSSTIKGPNHE